MSTVVPLQGLSFQAKVGISILFTIEILLSSCAVDHRDRDIGAEHLVASATCLSDKIPRGPFFAERRLAMKEFPGK